MSYSDQFGFDMGGPTEVRIKWKKLIRKNFGPFDTLNTIQRVTDNATKIENKKILCGLKICELKKVATPFER